MSELGAMIETEVHEIKSLEGTVEAEVDAGQQYVSVIARAPRNGSQNAVVFRSPDSPELALVVFDESEDYILDEWQKEGWELVMSARPL